MVLVIGILAYYVTIHPSAFYPSRLRLQHIMHVDPDDVLGEWKIELPHANFLGSSRMDNWKSSRLILCENGDCILVKPTEGIMLPEHSSHYLPEDFAKRKELVGKILYGKFSIQLEGRHLNQRQDENSETNILIIDCPPFYLAMPILKDPLGTGMDQYRILMFAGFPSERTGIVWKKYNDYSCPTPVPHHCGCPTVAPPPKNTAGRNNEIDQN